jgi:hypothetical protein
MSAPSLSPLAVAPFTPNSLFARPLQRLHKLTPTPRAPFVEAPALLLLLHRVLASLKLPVRVSWATKLPVPLHPPPPLRSLSQQLQRWLFSFKNVYQLIGNQSSESLHHLCLIFVSSTTLHSLIINWYHLSATCTPHHVQQFSTRANCSDYFSVLHSLQRCFCPRCHRLSP